MARTRGPWAWAAGAHGVVAASIRVGDRITAELVGAGDLIQPWNYEDAELVCEVGWRALLPTRFALRRVRIGLVVHPTRAIEQSLAALRRWAAAYGVDLVQIRASCEQQQVADQGDPVQCDLILSLGGDGTTLAAIRTAVDVARPVLAVACGSLGAGPSPT